MLWDRLSFHLLACFRIVMLVHKCFEERGCLRHGATSRKIVVSIYDGVFGIWHRYLALALTQPFNRNDYQGYFLGGKSSRCEGLTTSPPTCADSLEIWDPQLPGILRACNRPVQGLLLLCVIVYIFLSCTHLHSVWITKPN